MTDDNRCEYCGASVDDPAELSGSNPELQCDSCQCYVCAECALAPEDGELCGCVLCSECHEALAGRKRRR